MGFGSFVSGIGNSVKNVFSGIGKTFQSVVDEGKRFMKSDLGKVVMIAAAIWLGGAALGYWSSGFSTIDGALVATQAASAATPAAAAAGEAGAGTVAADSAAASATGGLSGGSAASGGAGAAVPAGATAGIGAGAPAAAAPVNYEAAHAALTQGPAAGGFMSSAGTAISGAAKWMAANPIPTLVGGQMLSNALSPNQLDVNQQQNQFRIDEENRRLAQVDAANKRLAGVGSVPTYSYSGAPLPPPTTPAAPGIMGRRLTI